MTRIIAENSDADFTIWATAEIPNVGMIVTVLSNKSPEPTAVVPCFCFSDAFSPPWLSFFR
jgi:hypothetical protein